MMNIKNGDGASEEQVQTTAEHPLRIAALRRFRAKLLAWLEDQSGLVDVRLTGEGGCKIDVDLGDGEWGWLTLETNTEL